MNTKILKAGNLIHKFAGIMKLSQMATNPVNAYKTLAVSIPKPFVYHIEMNRPTKRNALNNDMWVEFGECFNELAENPDCRVILLSGSGKCFTAGLDFTSAMDVGQKLAEQDDVARKAKILLKKIKLYQESISSVEKCPKPVIAAIHGACIGAGVDIITAADMRYCTSDARFEIKEIDLGMAADVGTLQRLPKVTGNQSLVKELMFTGRTFTAAEALQIGLISRVYDDKTTLIEDSTKIAEQIASKSPVAIQGTKLNLTYSRDHSVQEGLDHIALYNQAMLQSEDFSNAVVAQATKGDTPVFSKL